MKVLIPSLTVAFGLLIAVSASQTGNVIDPIKSAIFSDMATGVVMVTRTDTPSGGTGFALETPTGNKYIITNAHVCGTDTQMNLTDSSYTKYQSSVVKIDEPADLCMLFSPPNLRAFRIATEPSKRFERVFSLGHPLLEKLRPNAGFNLGEDLLKMILKVAEKKEDCPAFTDAEEVFTFFGTKIICIVSRNLVETSLTTLPGNSGSPVVNRAGFVVGVINSGHRELRQGNFIRLEELKTFIQDK